MKKILILILFTSVLTGCYGSYYEPEPVGIGKQPEELKMSPCACLQIDTKPGLPSWFVETYKG